MFEKLQFYDQVIGNILESIFLGQEKISRVDPWALGLFQEIIDKDGLSSL